MRKHPRRAKARTWAIFATESGVEAARVTTFIGSGVLCARHDPLRTQHALRDDNNEPY